MGTPIHGYNDGIAEAPEEAPEETLEETPQDGLKSTPRTRRREAVGAEIVRLEAELERLAIRNAHEGVERAFVKLQELESLGGGEISAKAFLIAMESHISLGHLEQAYEIGVEGLSRVDNPRSEESFILNLNDIESRYTKVKLKIPEELVGEIAFTVANDAMPFGRVERLSVILAQEAMAEFGEFEGYVLGDRSYILGDTSFVANAGEVVELTLPEAETKIYSAFSGSVELYVPLDEQVESDSFELVCLTSHRLFTPEKEQAFDDAVASLQQGEFQGLLPIGEYRLGDQEFSVEAGQDPVVLDFRPDRPREPRVRKNIESPVDVYVGLSSGLDFTRFSNNTQLFGGNFNLKIGLLKDFEDAAGPLGLRLEGQLSTGYGSVAQSGEETKLQSFQIQEAFAPSVFVAAGSAKVGLGPFLGFTQNPGMRSTITYQSSGAVMEEAQLQAHWFTGGHFFLEPNEHLRLAFGLQYSRGNDITGSLRDFGYDAVVNDVSEVSPYIEGAWKF